MRINFYSSMALNCIRKNKMLYLPYICTCTGMIMIYYILRYLSLSPVIINTPHSDSITMTLGFGCWVMLIFSMIFLFYTNSFLIKRRKKEFGLYNVLGMNKKKISRIVLCEALIIFAISMAAGLVLGIMFSKLSELAFLNVINEPTNFKITIAGKALLEAFIYYAIIFIIIALNTIRQIIFSNSIKLLRSENTGEKPPKGNIFLAIIGIILVAAAYYIAMTIKSPVTALTYFFFAVIMVIIGTYLIFIAASVVMCRLLKKNKKYYYKANHFVSVSSMAYRMKRNGAGLASICILATMVLVTLSSTICMYTGTEDSLNSRYPKDIGYEIYYSTPEGFFNNENSRKIITDNRSEYDPDATDILEYYYGYMGCFFTDGKLESTSIYIDNFAKMNMVIFMSLEEYNEIAGKHETLNDDEILLYIQKGSYTGKEISLENIKNFKIKKQVKSFVDNGNGVASVTPTWYIILPNFKKNIYDLRDELAKTGHEHALSLIYNYEYNTDISLKTQLTATDDAINKLQTLRDNETDDIMLIYSNCKEEARSDFYSLYGSLFFLGILLSTVFLLAAVLIIYYKQICEGFEDQSKFHIMQKIGMTKKDIRKSINSQLLTVFFAPLLLSGIHLAFAFKYITKILMLFGITNTTLLIIIAILCFVVFGCFYSIIYKITSNSYYKIVS